MKKIKFLAIFCALMCAFILIMSGRYLVKEVPIRLIQFEPNYALRNSESWNQSYTVDASNCKDLNYPTISSFDNDWLNVSRENLAYVYSAYRDGENIRIIGAAWTKRIGNTSLFCQIWARNRSLTPVMVSVNASIIFLPEDHYKRYSAAYFMCPVSGILQPFAVSLVENEPCSKPQHILPLTSSPRSSSGRFTVCIAPLHSDLSLHHELINSIEFNRILGADYFVFYNYSLDYVTDKILSYYSRRGLAEVLSWNLKLNNSVLHYYGQNAAINDCMFRHRNVTDYVVVVDLDEFILPKYKSDMTWNDILKRLPKASSYTFRHMPFRVDWNSSIAAKITDIKERNTIEKLKLVVFSKLDRESDHSQSKTYRAKTMVNPKVTNMTGIHTVWEHTEGSNWLVDKRVAVVNHYRNRTGLNIRVNSRTELTAMKYKNVLIDRVQKIWQDIHNDS